MLADLAENLLQLPGSDPRLPRSLSLANVDDSGFNLSALAIAIHREIYLMTDPDLLELVGQI